MDTGMDVETFDLIFLLQTFAIENKPYILWHTILMDGSRMHGF
jgi:hypothetical protein